MVTPWYERLFQLIGFDILLIGALFYLAVLIARELNQPNSPYEAFGKGWEKFRKEFGLQPSPTSNAQGKLPTVKAIGGGAAILMLAAAGGMVLDGVAHRVVDWEESKELNINNLFKFDVPDDRIKRNAFYAVASTTTDVWDKCDPKRTKDASRGANEQWATRQAKELYQEAYLRILDSDKKDIKSSLARDELLLKLFRVMFVLSGLLFMITLGTVWRSHKKQRLEVALTLGLATFLFLYLWSAQSRHYYKRVFHAYAIIVQKGDQKIAGFLPPQPEVSMEWDCGTSKAEQKAKQ